ncbi:MAG: hypothetical protein ACFFDT_24065 [Candidatus Hodarchaeota archaeon]
MKRILDKLKKKEVEPETWQNDSDSIVIVEPMEEQNNSEKTEWGKGAKITFKHGVRTRIIRILAVIYIFLNIIIGILFTSNSMLVNLVVFLYLAPNTIILLHYLKLIHEK